MPLTPWIFDKFVIGGGNATNSFIAQYQAVYDALTTPPDSSVASAQNTMVSSLVDAGVWAKLDVFYLFAQTTNGGGEALINWVNPGTHDATVVNSPTFTALEGMTTNGTDNYLNTHYNPSDDGVNFGLNSGQISFYDRGNNLDNGQAAGSCTTSTADDACYVNVNLAGSLNGTIYKGSAKPAFTTSDSRGLNTVSRTASNKCEVLWNGVSKDTNTTAAGVTANGFDFYIGSGNVNGSPDSHTGRQYAMVCVGGGLIESEVLSLFNAIETYMDSNSKGVVS